MVCYENCCCCLDRKTGARIISYLGLFFGFLGLLGNIWGFFTLKPKTHLELALIRFQISSEVRIRFGSEFADIIDSLDPLSLVYLCLGISMVLCFIFLVANYLVLVGISTQTSGCLLPFLFIVMIKLIVSIQNFSQCNIFIWLFDFPNSFWRLIGSTQFTSWLKLISLTTFISLANY